MGAVSSPHNIDELMAEPDIDGVLVGGASLQVESFARIVELPEALIVGGAACRGASTGEAALIILDGWGYASAGHWQCNSDCRHASMGRFVGYLSACAAGGQRGGRGSAAWSDGQL